MSESFLLEKGEAAGEVEVKRYQSDSGRFTRYWAVYVDTELLAVVLYRKGAMAIAKRLETMRR